MTVKNGVSETTALTGGAGVGQTITLTGQENAWNPTFAQAYGGAATDIPVAVIVGNDWQTCRCDFNGTTGLTVQSIQATYKGGVYDDSAPTGVTLTGTPVAQVGMNAASLVDNLKAIFTGYAAFDAQVAADATVAFADGNKQTVDAAVNSALTLTFPGVGSYILRITNSASLSTITPTPLWDSGTAPSWAGTSILALYYDGTDVYGSAIVGAA